MIIYDEMWQCKWGNRSYHVLIDAISVGILDMISDHFLHTIICFLVKRFYKN